MNLSEIKPELRKYGWEEHPHKWFVWGKRVKDTTWTAHIGSISSLSVVSPFVVYINKVRENGENYYKLEQLIDKLKLINAG